MPTAEKAPKAVPTHYGHTLYRSRLEARWAIFFDLLGIDFIYEPKGYDFETKAPGKKPEAHQQLWLDRRQLTGITTGWFSSFDSFVQWYRQRYGMRGGDPPPIREPA